MVSYWIMTGKTEIKLAVCIHEGIGILSCVFLAGGCLCRTLGIVGPGGAGPLTTL